MERFANIVDVCDPKFEKQRMESISQNTSAVQNASNAQVASLNSFYERKVECLEQILTSGYVDRDANTPQINYLDETDADYVDVATAPWHF